MNRKQLIRWTCDLPFCFIENFQVLNPGKNPKEHIRSYIREQGLSNYMRKKGSICLGDNEETGRDRYVWTRHGYNFHFEGGQ